MTRAEFLRSAACATASWLIPQPLRALAHAGCCAVPGSRFPVPGSGSAFERQRQPSRSAELQFGLADGEQQARVARVIAAYDRQGIHRTGTPADDQSAVWLADEARKAGASVTLESFPLARVDVRACFVRIGDRRIEGLPLFDGTFTDARGVTGAIGPPEAGTPIALVRLDATGISSEGRPITQLRRSGRHRAVVVVTMGPHHGLSPMNAPAFTGPFGPPVVQVSSEDATWLDAQAAARTEVHVVAHAERVPVQARNVVVSVGGQKRDLASLIVMTPRSGWWQCAAERGGGLACWLETIRAVSAAKTPRTAIFVASSGHELGHLGLDSFIGRRRDLVKGAAAWLHLGANIGAADGRTRLQASDDRIGDVAVAALTRAGTAVASRIPRGTVPAGEARNIHEGGGRYISLLGSSPFFHSPADRWPAAVDVAAVTRYAAAMSDLALTLASTPTG